MESNISLIVISIFKPYNIQAVRYLVTPYVLSIYAEDTKLFTYIDIDEIYTKVE